MLQFLSHLARRAPTDLHAQALCAGAALGWVAFELSRVGGGAAFPFAMTLVMLGFGAASFACYALHLHGHARPSGQPPGTTLRNCLSLLGCGVAASIQLLAASAA
jgi:hypothetical protein